MNSRSLIRYILYAIILLLMLAGFIVASVYKQIYLANITTPYRKDYLLYVPTGSDYQDVVDLLTSADLIKNQRTFSLTASRKKYPEHIHPGRYRIKHNMSNNALLNMLRSGWQEPVNVIINMARTPDDLAKKIAGQIEADQGELVRLMHDEPFLEQFGFNKFTVLGMFLPNTYEFWWNTNADGFIRRMYKEYGRFWNREQKVKAREMDFTQNQVMTLASIIINETNQEEEYARIAGVYLNRLHKGMRLQADPTIKFALGDFERQRILKTDTYIESPYNTYLHPGLPPGPISIPSVKAIDAVLHYERHDYFYFCAKEDFSGYHNFASTFHQHNKNARSYQKALNQRKILK